MDAVDTLQNNKVRKFKQFQHLFNFTRHTRSCITGRPVPGDCPSLTILQYPLQDPWREPSARALQP